MYKYINICLFLCYLYVQNVVSYRIYQLNSEEEKQLLPKIRELLSQNNKDLEYQNTIDRPTAKNEPMGKSVFVKRIIPHGYVTGEYEYDSKLNTVFRPVARFHVQNTEENHITSLLKQMAEERRQKDRYAKDLVLLVQEEEIKQDLINQIEKYLGADKKEQKLKQFKGFETLNGLGKGSLVSLRQPSGQNYDPFAYGRLPPEMVRQSSQEKTVEKTVYPSYPFWNYWTYSQSVAQDRCPGNLIRLGNMCINSLGHRRFADPHDTRRARHNKQRRSIRASRKRHLYGKR